MHTIIQARGHGTCTLERLGPSCLLYELQIFSPARVFRASSFISTAQSHDAKPLTPSKYIGANGSSHLSIAIELLSTCIPSAAISTYLTLLHALPSPNPPPHLLPGQPRRAIQNHAALLRAPHPRSHPANPELPRMAPSPLRRDLYLRAAGALEPLQGPTKKPPTQRVQRRLDVLAQRVADECEWAGGQEGVG